MREILFRGKCPDSNKWYYGSLYWDRFNERYEIKFYDTIYDYDTAIIPLDETIGQYTGLVDKNGTKIYEGDIVKGNFPYAKKCVVVWDNKRCGFYLKPISKLGRVSYDPYYKLNSAKLEIIGNIFDNGELLNEN